MNIKEVKLYKKYLHQSTNSIVEVLNIDVDTNNVFIRNSKLIDGWYEIDEWVHVKHLLEFEVKNED